ncbi:TPA: hypothetical protein JEL96_004617 [Salmonella enterica subsp. enterica serovar Westhampton]|nr:hypothetical protein [Salmonella enterica subsp. enterica serovar Westhampton]
MNMMISYQELVRTFPNLGVVSGGNARYYDIQELLIGKSPEAVAAANINIAYDESASCKPENIIITVAA